MMADDIEYEYWCCTGMEMHGNKRSIGYFRVEGEDPKRPSPWKRTTRSSFTLPNKKYLKATSVGVIYKVGRTEENQYRMSGEDAPVSAGLWADRDEVAAWRAAERTADLAASARKNEKEFARDCLMDVLKPLAMRRSRMSPAKQAAFDVLILQILRRAR